MFARILVPLDGTDEAAAILAPTSTLAAATGATLHLLEVLGRGAPAGARTEAAARLDRVAAALRAGGRAVEATVREGAPAEEIVAAVAGLGADLISMATYGRSGLARAFLGSVAEHVLGASPVPVMVLRPPGRGMAKLDTLLVPVDGSSGEALALVSAGLARAVNARIVLVYVVVPLLAYATSDAAGYAAGLYSDPAWDEGALEAARRYVSVLVARLRESGVRTHGRATAGQVLSPAASVVTAVMGEADEVGADLIVMSTRTHTEPLRPLLGGVADAVVRQAHRPVLFVRRSRMRP